MDDLRSTQLCGAAVFILARKSCTYAHAQNVHVPSQHASSPVSPSLQSAFHSISTTFYRFTHTSLEFPSWLITWIGSWDGVSIWHYDSWLGKDVKMSADNNVWGLSICFPGRLEHRLQTFSQTFHYKIVVLWEFCYTSTFSLALQLTDNVLH